MAGLLLEIGDPADVMARAGFSVGAEGIRYAVIGLPSKFDESLYPAGLADFYRAVGFVDWAGLMVSGGIGGPASAESKLLNIDYFNYSGTLVPPSATRVIGAGFCGDMLICTAGGRAGWMCHENNRVKLLGTDLDLIDWVFGELLADRSPEYDHAWAA